jgi:hypothetical protein
MKYGNLGAYKSDLKCFASVALPQYWYRLDLKAIKVNCKIIISKLSKNAPSWMLGRQRRR